MKKGIDFFTAHPARFFLLAALLWGGFICLISIIRGKFDSDGFWVEANGMVFDLFVFGVLLSIYEALREKRDKIEHLHEEIDDYRGWDEKEATYRIVGAIKRLRKIGVREINLKSCFLKRADLEGINLERTYLLGANLEGANLVKANLMGAYLAYVNLQDAKLWKANLQGAILFEAYLLNAIFMEANLRGVELQGAFVGNGWFEKLEKWSVKGREEIKEKYFIDKNEALKERQRNLRHEDEFLTEG